MSPKRRRRALTEQERAIARQIGRRIQAAREDAGVTRAALAEAMEMDYDTLARIERGQAYHPLAAHVVRIAAFLGVPPGDLLPTERPYAPCLRVVQYCRQRWPEIETHAGRIRALAAERGVSFGAARKWYYGERHAPDDITPQYVRSGPKPGCGGKKAKPRREKPPRYIAAWQEITAGMGVSEIRQAARRAQVSFQATYNWRRAGMIPNTRAGRAFVAAAERVLETAE